MGRQCKTIDAITYGVAYIAMIVCNAATFLMQLHAMRMQHMSSSLSTTLLTIMHGRHGADYLCIRTRRSCSSRCFRLLWLDEYLDHGWYPPWFVHLRSTDDLPLPPLPLIDYRDAMYDAVWSKSFDKASTGTFLLILIL